MEKYTVDFTGVKNWMEIHPILKESLDFPDYYGENWDAMWDSFKGSGDDPMLIEIKGLNTLSVKLKEYKEYIDTMMSVFDDLTEEYPNIKVEVLS